MVALDVAILPPPGVRDLAVQLSASLPPAESKGFMLDEEHLPHLTLTQQFVRASDVEEAFDCVDTVLRAYPPLRLRVIGGGNAGSTVWLSIERVPELLKLHRQLMDALAELEARDGDLKAFYEDARPQDLKWVSTFRHKASFDKFTPHITLGHALRPPHVEPQSFTATTVAACHLGRFCTCRRVLREWTLRENRGAKL
jgi:2'-5' RNA ligase